MILTSWELACVEYALAYFSDYRKSVQREDLNSGTESAYKKITDFIKSTETKCAGDKMDYSVSVTASINNPQETEDE